MSKTSQRRATLRSSLLLEGSFVAQRSGRGVSVAIGPSLGLGARLGRRFDLLALAQAPLLGARYAVDDASASMSQAQAWLELRVELWSARRLMVHALTFAGTEHLSVRGKAMAPYLPQRDAAWTALTGLGVSGTLRLFGPMSLGTALRALLLAPRPLIHVGDDSVAVGRPLVQVTVGLHVSL
jgi:hypothetical protein